MTEQTAKSGRRCLAVVLAAGLGSRMKSAQPKVLHALAGRSMLAHVLATLREADVSDIVVVVGPDQEGVAQEAAAMIPHATIAIQAERLGTAHAVLAARKSLEKGFDDLLVVFADTPLVSAETFIAMRAVLAETKAAALVLGFEAADPTGYGRLILEQGQLIAIREERDADPSERALTLCNGGLMALAGEQALGLLDRIGKANAQGEYYLTDIVALARDTGQEAEVLIVPEDEVMGVNDRVQLARAESLLQDRLREKAMRAGATLIDPASIFLSFDTQLDRDVIVEPHVVFGPGVTIGEGARIRAFSHLEEARVGAGAIIGPFARLRPGADLAEAVHIGNFVEIKATKVGAGAKINHLSYIGDASIGAKTNIGAGTITCNYDGFGKFKTEIGAGAFIGSQTALVAPVKVGDGAYVGTGSVITHDVPEDALAIARERQIDKPGWAKAFREKYRK
ncbi:bifunctional UDP-N-acetylglucosamine diphosphorylase/glucosamine-1-phosphate N-acetyltransferase GlmU [Beijerinckia indica]|uniref:Bifunctional protein GlmU n=1 Tax=Beijerinckia indica subsp. indica (strain ATCC 9039 / DSM 1715 / NCIMB 8712) TaxID=395963 RepID=B2IDJ4_BEII9|nr:bifunctional UDP-N-acetylglucosamine diphosphorylase/glucosamine-1-phosphate N-acetyltransferase GlmU [Beijerinckia indica]ACB95430.1 UDP-N-acetylglucosamine pyrophosphorylase [Beijerinckia indica subsp. indica ATCC 9039]